MHHGFFTLQIFKIQELVQISLTIRAVKCKIDDSEIKIMKNEREIAWNMKNLIKKMYESSVIRYIFFGGCTTMVNLISFYILRKMGMALTPANVISIILAILFAYVVNSLFVFQDKCEKLVDHIKPFCKFISARLITMVIEVGGVWLIVEVLKMNDMVGKFITQFIVLALNYIFSKFFVFTTGK